MEQEDILQKYWFFKPDYSLKVNLVAFGLECGRGWYNLIDELCSELAELIDDEYPEFKEDFQVVQVKEKFGTLRFYVNYGNDKIFELIDYYENLSAETCEYCGKDAELRTRGSWYATLCDECNSRWQNGETLWTLG